MLQTIETHWIVLAVAVALVLLVALWLLGRARRAAAVRQRRRPDVLDEGAAPAQRNQALIDAPSATAAAFAGTGPDILAGMGEVVAVAAADEAIAASEAAPAPPPVAEPAAADGDADDLRRIKGVGPKLVALLATLGVTRFAQIAAWTEADIDRIDAQLGAFTGRIRRDSWVEQASLLAADDTAGFEAKFGKL